MSAARGRDHGDQGDQYARPVRQQAPRALGESVATAKRPAIAINVKETSLLPARADNGAPRRGSTDDGRFVPHTSLC
jgi:hypothetical protein